MNSIDKMWSQHPADMLDDENEKKLESMNDEMPLREDYETEEEYLQDKKAWDIFKQAFL